MTNRERKLLDALFMALTLDWHDNGEISAEATRDACIQTIADVTERSFEAIVALIEERVHTTH
ncbi:hypothetical protein EHM69_10490 [candidate division KSB1 bacterium]|nr:MAG: hypothetical protein EHM69_10490 [candidate division KSB1 bacterium]